MGFITPKNEGFKWGSHGSFHSSTFLVRSDLVGVLFFSVGGKRVEKKEIESRKSKKRSTVGLQGSKSKLVGGFNPLEK